MSYIDYNIKGFSSNILRSILLLFIVTGCSSKPEKLGALDLVMWRADRGGCKNERILLEETFKKEQEKIMGKFADEVGVILGKPDVQQLGGRNQKSYVYFLESGPQCENITFKSSARKVVLRFNALGLLSEVTYHTLPLK